MKIRNFVSFIVLCAFILSISACTPSPKFHRYRTKPATAGKASPEKKSTKKRSQKVEDSQGNYRKGQVLKGVASYYGPGFHGKQTASGEIFDQNALTCAHKFLPFGTVLNVKLVSTGSNVVVRVTDRGPFVGDRILDLSVEAARRLGMITEGTGYVNAEIISLGGE